MTIQPIHKCRVVKDDGWWYIWCDECLRQERFLVGLREVPLTKHWDAAINIALSHARSGVTGLW